VVLFTKASEVVRFVCAAVPARLNVVSHNSPYLATWHCAFVSVATKDRSPQGFPIFRLIVSVGHFRILLSGKKAKLHLACFCRFEVSGPPYRLQLINLNPFMRQNGPKEKDLF
jgi:hypothetical protein